jgi:aminodeoxyfutalosine deaminase
MAKAAGLRLTGHTMSLDDVRFALEAGFHRLDHGWLAASHPDLVSRIANAGSVMTFTPMAYVLGGHKADIAWHQAYSALTAAGIPVVIGTDDPALHHTDITHSYEIVARRLGWDGSDLASAARASFLHSWSSSGDRPAIERNLAEIDRLVIAPRGGREANDDQAGSASRSAG